MNDLDLVRTLRADVPPPAPARLAAGRSRILAAAAARRRRYWRLALPVGAVTAAAAVAVVAVLGGTATPSHLRPAATPSRPRPAATGRVSLAAQILTVAARTVAAEPAARPGDRQWIYTRFVQTQTGTGHPVRRELDPVRRPRAGLLPERAAHRACTNPRGAAGR